jgi:hypothetical protein
MAHRNNTRRVSSRRFYRPLSRSPRSRWDPFWEIFLGKREVFSCFRKPQNHARGGMGILTFPALYDAEPHER